MKAQGAGPHIARTLMLEDLRELLSRAPVDAPHEAYRVAVVEANALHKPTASARRETTRRIGQLYGLDPSLAVFRALRTLWDVDGPGQPLLACLCANARDPLLRLSAPAIWAAEFGDAVGPEVVAQAIADSATDRYGPATISSMCRNSLSSWRQSGHLQGKLHKVRSRAVATPASTAYALLLGYITGARGLGLLETYWARLLDAPEPEVDELAFQASRLGLIRYRRLGDVLEVSFEGLLTPREVTMLDGGSAEAP